MVLVRLLSALVNMLTCQYLPELLVRGIKVDALLYKVTIYLRQILLICVQFFMVKIGVGMSNSNGLICFVFVSDFNASLHWHGLLCKPVYV